jgi:hypothetical protein
MKNNFQVYYPKDKDVLDFIKNHNEDFNSKLTKYFSIWHTLIFAITDGTKNDTSGNIIQTHEYY